MRDHTRASWGLSLWDLEMWKEAASPAEASPGRCSSSAFLLRKPSPPNSRKDSKSIVACETRPYTVV